jgi:hypothetical protein
MRRFALALAAATTLLSAAAFTPANAITIGVGAAQGIQAAAEEGNLVEDVAYVCRHRGYGSRRACWWRPGGYYGGYGVYRGYRGYGRGYYGGYRGGYRGYRRW